MIKWKIERLVRAYVNSIRPFFPYYSPARKRLSLQEAKAWDKRLKLTALVVLSLVTATYIFETIWR